MFCQPLVISSVFVEAFGNFLAKVPDPQLNLLPAVELFWAQCYKTFLSVIYELSKQARVFVPGKLFQPSLIFEGKSGACPIRVFERWFT